jgi:microsomal dipeptidase-like Zn-dependent dipeptidase
MIREMNAVGILIDLAHTNDVCARDIIETSENDTAKI